MHQPYYKDPFSGLFKLPWVRLHATKDYLDMVSILREFPSVRQNFNLVPSLIEQFKEYEAGTKDIFQIISEKPAHELSSEEKGFLLENFFFANWDRMIKPIPRYYELLKKRGLRRSSLEIRDSIKYFTDTDYRDIQVLFNLVWIDPYLRKTDPVIAEIEKKGSGFSEQDKSVVLAKHIEIIRKIIPEYKALWESGQIEVSASPYYHPILPLLIDTNSAKEALPDIKLPMRRFRRPEDARAQVRTALEYFEKVFGRRPEGMWPSEGAVSEATLTLLAEESLKWTASDEDVLGASLGIKIRNGTGHVADPSVLYRAYRYRGINILFRDHGLSDLIGFVYSSWKPKDAAKNLIENLLTIRRSLLKKKGFIVPIILDGENAWENYENDGRDFLFYLYDGLSKEESLRAVTISEHLRENPNSEELKGLRSGSWIYANFRTWIGHEEDNLSWDYLTDTRDRFEEFKLKNPDKDLSSIKKYIFISEGSDWNWWYGDEHVTDQQKEFDELYRANLNSAWRQMSVEPPQYLYVPILLEDRAIMPTAPIRGFITPKIDGFITGFFEWYQSASLNISKSGGSMHRTESLMSDIYYGFDASNLYIRLDPKVPFGDFPVGASITLVFLRPHEFMLDVPLRDATKGVLYERAGDNWVKKTEITSVAVGEIFEAGIAFSLINAVENDEINLCVMVNSEGREIERCPLRGYISIIVPTPDFEERMWY